MTSGRPGTVAALVGALALTVLTAPPAQAAATGITVSDIVINGGRPVVVGTTQVKEPALSFRISLPAGYSTADPFRYDAHPFLYHDTTPAKGADNGGIYVGGYTCYEQSARTARCEGNLYIDPPYRLDSGNDATTWKIGVVKRLWKADGGLKAEEYNTAPGGVRVQRAAKVTVNASPGPVTKGRALTVTGGLTRADRVKHKYTGYGSQSVELRFRKADSSACTTVKKVKTSSTGALKTTVTASADGYRRFVFGGTTTTGTATATGDFVDVR
ncbi:hypothetical protein OHS70_10880 [Streptomyces sp. NBC_00390]|uniref:hypothetical protein n=1 Tax=Streptomyces sp. NBC_00390 TaxID=2975736 RepID=UPI002E22757C